VLVAARDACWRRRQGDEAPGHGGDRGDCGRLTAVGGLCSAP
jgi:hypothetical protein